VKTIPQTFLSLEQYLSSISYPLIEETRADLCSSLETLSKAPCIEIQSIAEVPENSFVYCIELGVQENSVGKEAYTPMNADILVLTESRPRHISDLIGNGRTYTIALVVKTGHSGGILSPDKFIMKTSQRVPVEKYSKRKEQGKSLFATFLLTMTPSNRIWKSMDLDTVKQRNSSIINMAWAYNSLVCTKILSCLLIVVIRSKLKVT